MLDTFSSKSPHFVSIIPLPKVSEIELPANTGNANVMININSIVFIEAPFYIKPSAPKARLLRTRSSHHASLIITFTAHYRMLFRLVNQHSDHDSITTFFRRFLTVLEKLEVLTGRQLKPQKRGQKKKGGGGSLRVFSELSLTVTRKPRL